jgi:hypothetical protein
VKKLISKTSRHWATSPLRQPNLSLKGVLGETAALLTSACNGSVPRISLASAMNPSTSSGKARSAVMCCAQLGSRLQAAGTSSREQVMIRQPSLLKRSTVACPIPRLAPVRIKVLG